MFTGVLLEEKSHAEKRKRFLISFICKIMFMVVVLEDTKEVYEFELGFTVTVNNPTVTA